MLKSFERRLINKFDELETSSGADDTDCAIGGHTEDNKVCPVIGGGRLYHC